jgi:predicted MPP superfamily phosphohydrolase
MIERKLIGTSRYSISSARLPKNSKPVRFVLLADLHDVTFGKKNERLVKRINALAPDFILVAGDMINKKEPCFPSNAYYLLESLAKKYKIYYAYGNHEQRMEQYGLQKDPRNSDRSMNAADNDSLSSQELYTTWVEYREKLKSFGVIFLDNESTRISEGKVSLGITGISIGYDYFVRYKKIPDMETKYLKHLVTSDKKVDFHILIAHNPFYFENYLEWGADLVVSGHFHGGMVRLPGIGGIISPQAKFFPKYDSGKYEKEGRYMVVSRGLGSHSIMPRLFNVPDLISIELKGENTKGVT